MGVDPTAEIHPAAIVEEGARIGPGARVGPWCHVGARVELGEGVELISHVVVAGRTSLGAGTRVWPFASLGTEPQDLKYHGEESRLEIGPGNMIREHVTMNPGTEGGGGLTRIGSGGLFMMSSHVGHDCMVGDGVILANNAPLGGHVVVQDRAIIGGNAAVHQHARIGRGAIVGGLTGVERDVIPYASVVGDRARLAGLNLIGLRRAKVPRAEVSALREAVDFIFGGEGALADRARDAALRWPESALVREVCAFMEEGSSRSFVTPRDGG
ncbi:MAG: acyl-ACP--UDP-N-acetylglucosamine O-acyltransferase [Pseudomonadota bacterium]